MKAPYSLALGGQTTHVFPVVENLELMVTLVDAEIRVGLVTAEPQDYLMGVTGTHCTIVEMGSGAVMLVVGGRGGRTTYVRVNRETVDQLVVLLGNRVLDCRPEPSA